MKPSERIMQLLEKVIKDDFAGGIGGLDDNDLRWAEGKAIRNYLDEEHEKKQFKNQNVIENNTFYQINDTPKS